MAVSPGVSDPGAGTSSSSSSTSGKCDQDPNYEKQNVPELFLCY